MRFTTWTLSAFLLAGGVASASEDWTVVSKSTRNGQPEGNTTKYFSADHVKIERGGGRDTLIDLKTHVMTTFDGRKKTYYTTTQADMDAFNAKMAERMNDPKAKKGMQAMQEVADGTASSYDVKKTGETRKVGPYTCEEWVITLNAASTMKECVTTEVQFPARLYDALKLLGEGMTGSGPFGSLVKSGEARTEKMRAIKGYPVWTSMEIGVMGTKTTIESEVVEIRHTAIPESTWAVPAGYSKIDNPMLRAFDRHG